MRAKKQFGQNFLTSTQVVQDIVRAGELTKNDTVLEIGPGRGVLTLNSLVKKPIKKAPIKEPFIFLLLMTTKFTQRRLHLRQIQLQLPLTLVLFLLQLLFQIDFLID
jgi:16S rRNA (adenine1518-N6/adenine1519-N6)-dimethyltransferase